MNMTVTYLHSIDIEYHGQTLITDIDDCLIHTTQSIKDCDLDKRSFWFDDGIYSLYKDEVMSNAEFTAWGYEFLNHSTKATFNEVILLTAAGDRLAAIKKKFFFNDSKVLDSVKVIEGCADTKKIEFLNDFTDPCIYVDDKPQVVYGIKNPLVKSILFKLK
ncbi:hypothetical protein [Ulvibacterium sp.]|uniref:hypothetical protein n=1 Tax=Ulvibacterium sp. TaxID=2665914 RepID=UPI0026060341|nr:hypothetical protein [Ulvibacterium sp.]